MKKIVFAASACLLLLASCGALQRTTNTATIATVQGGISSSTVADLEVGKRVSFKYTTTKEDRNGGSENCKKAAISALLKANGNADILVNPEFNFKSDLQVIEVSGRPAFYKNFRPAN